jgi:tRNA modification GTPase
MGLSHPTLGDTIAAIATSMGESSRRIIVRTSGPDARRLAGIGRAGVHQVTRSIDGLPEIEMMLLVFVAPRSATGEDVVEYHLPGNRYLATKLLEELFAKGARQAQPGEFTARALLTGKIDLTEAEGVAATIGATQRSELIASRQLMAGELSKRILPLIDELAQTLALTEVGIDFTDEDVTFLEPHVARQRVMTMKSSLEKLLSESPRFEQVGREPTVVLVGKPNAGKSTLLNLLAGYERAVVSPVAGTTRDAIEASAKLPGGWVRVIDIAGLDAALQSDQADIDQQMRQQAMRAIEQADVVVLVKAIDDTTPDLVLDRAASLTVYTKADVLNDATRQRAVVMSRDDRKSLELLRSNLGRLCFGDATWVQREQAVSLNARHRTEISGCIDALARSLESLDSGAEFFAFDLRVALDHLGRIVGTVSADDVLGRVFSTFCIGK